MAGALTENREMSDLLAKNWWAMALRGVLAIVVGLIALAAPGVALLSFALMFAAYLIADGLFGVAGAIWAAQKHERWGLLLAEGALNLVIGVVAAFFPLAAVVAFALLAAFWALATGALLLASAFALTPAHGRWWMILSGVVSILFGVALLIAPLIGAVVLTWWFAGYALAFGAFLLVLAFRLRRERRQTPSVSL
ncbi:HdeD family acid-resistance protein [Hansschlegelia sp.]|uniref:HdeD family acid-resistance protein n=1 Tax=Hansschlegelia sp. TaxID=2041892 RepID=UPI002C27B789|nr:HdeD family acid-resistance protein [Hansschlegelia sp.]HVI30394.1 HdeD family acid-resistance protein [Hansschlegelia sp.]